MEKLLDFQIDKENIEAECNLLAANVKIQESGIS